MQKIAAALGVQLRSNATGTMAVVKQVINGTNIMFHDLLFALKHKTEQTFENHGVDMQSEDIQSLLTKFDDFSNPFHGLETVSQQSKYMEDKLNLVKPVEIALLGVRYDQYYDKVTGEWKQKLVTESFQYISVLEVLQLILKPDVRE